MPLTFCGNKIASGDRTLHLDYIGIMLLFSFLRRETHNIGDQEFTQ